MTHNIEKATISRYERFKEKYRIVLMGLTYVTLLILFFYVYHYATELSTHPLKYVQDKYNLSVCYSNSGEMYSFNETGVWIEKMYYNSVVP